MRHIDLSAILERLEGIVSTAEFVEDSVHFLGTAKDQLVSDLKDVILVSRSLMDILERQRKQINLYRGQLEAAQALVVTMDKKVNLDEPSKN